MPKQDDENGKPLWLTSIQIGLAALGIVGAGLGTALRLILDGYGHPEFQLFVYNITGGTILLFIFAFAMGSAAFVAAQGGKQSHLVQSPRSRFLVGISTLSIVCFFFIFGLANLYLAIVLFERGSPFIQSLQDALAAETSP